MRVIIEREKRAVQEFRMPSVAKIGI